MREKLNKVKTALHGNSGSGIVLVLVCMMCVSILGVMILYLSYTGFMMKVTQRQGKTDFYSASTAMDEIRAGIQKGASDCISDAYKTVLVNYNYAGYITDDATMEDKFQTEFKNNFVKEYRFNSDTEYDINKLKDYASNDKVTVSSVDNSLSFDKDKNEIVLKNLKVEYADSKGYTTSISTDISIDMPDFTYVSSDCSTVGLPSYALIADTELSANTGNNLINGSAYAGKVSLIGDGSFSNANGWFICKNNISVDSGHKLAFAEDTTVWADRIVVGNDSGIAASGKTYVHDDLDLSGYKASATLSGRYYGFGDSQEESKNSSSIIANGRATTLNISGLKSLMLAGRSFISNDFGTNNDEIEKKETLMGESLSVRGNQMAYLVPLSMLDIETSEPNQKPSNPIVFSEDQPVVELNDLGKAAAEKNGFTLKQMIMVIPGSQKVAYYFMNFNTPEKANSFFKTYFNAHKSDIESYMSQYMDLSTTSSMAANIAGYMPQKSDDGYKLLPGDDAIPSIIHTDEFQKRFSLLSSTLARGSDFADGTTPYTYFINTEKMSKLGAKKEFKDEAGNVVGIIVNNLEKEDYSLSAQENSNLRIVVASGNIMVSGEYNGLLIARGKITLQANAQITADNAGVTTAFSATYGDSDETLSEYFLHGVPSGTEGAAEAHSGSSWNLDKLITYKNWHKN